ncbi:MAG: VWA domain-containing protein [Rhodospirillales bacterium]|nr:VWA domain-containing protein [Rhodospirillales bacterium]MCW8861738.1 VWA domain-containing protein [Rhodospirillales bacterium]MCW9003383.1 VWA domain-containing protein [Rhodospirillales bacterium]
MERDAALQRLNCGFEQVESVLDGCLAAAESAMTPDGVEAWLAGAGRICRLGRGVGPVLAYLETMPDVVRLNDETVLEDIANAAELLSSRACGREIEPFITSLPAIGRRTGGVDGFRRWLHVVDRISVHASNGLPALIEQAPHVLRLLNVSGLERWVDFGLVSYSGDMSRLPEFFGLATADAVTALQRQRHGTLLIDRERELGMILRALWSQKAALCPYTVENEQNPRLPHMDSEGIHLPDLLDDVADASAQDRYRARLAHMAAHRKWSVPFLADNFSIFQHLPIEIFEDSRVEALAMKTYPGLGDLWRSLHPIPKPDACPADMSSIRHKLAMLSRALLDPDHGYEDPLLLDFVARFQARFDANPLDQSLSSDLGVEWLKESYNHSFRKRDIWFEDTIVDYRDDNRFLWRFLEDVKNENEFNSDYGAFDRFVHGEGDDEEAIPPRHYHEWDHKTRSYRPDWTSVYDAPSPVGDGAVIDAMFARNRPLAERLRRIFDRLNHQDRIRLRGQKDGDELDLDRVIRSRIDMRQGFEPDPRVFQSHKPGGREIAVMLLIDQSQSTAETPEGSTASILQTAQEATTLLAWATQGLGDPLAVAGFASDTRHQVLFHRVKNFEEPWGHVPKSRLSGIEAGLSTRMGAALRHAGWRLESRKERRRLLLVLSDGEPADVDEDDPAHLRWDAHAAVNELRARGITPFCITLDPKADEYVADIFGKHGYAVVDRLARLPERLATLFLALTRA